eukprot:CAMPEP_0172507184 /NCGR_PEP_ID=MMETSP1066-20121228/202024_1 /TAXON_ID=671091 /ORGANISM="Coscinodiscus wailesii, Strain CCMP2513" /LENGTH=336 /DNA_ID=CAMNT_0013284641 /DNA_START=66 /DNA_END=1076 /DNA_ORIENTATION=+
MMRTRSLYILLSLLTIVTDAKTQLTISIIRDVSCCRNSQRPQIITSKLKSSILQTELKKYQQQFRQRHEWQTPSTSPFAFVSSEIGHALITRGGSGYYQDDRDYSRRGPAADGGYRPRDQQQYEDDYQPRQRRSRRSDYYYEDEDDENRDDYYRDDGYADDDRGYYDDRPPQQQPANKPDGPSPLSKLTSFKPNRKLGTAFLFSGLALTLLGISLFFNKTLLRLGNLLVILGVPLTIGPGRTMSYFFQPKKARATGCLLVGIFFVLILGKPVLGMAMEIFGLLNLFGNMFPVLLAMLRQVPVLGDLIPDGRSKKKRGRDDDYRYDDRRDENVERYY